MKSIAVIPFVVMCVVLFLQFGCDSSKEDTKRETEHAQSYADLKCSIRPLKDSIKQGENIEFILTLQNIGYKVIHLPKTRIKGESGLWIAMTGEKGEKFLQVNMACPIEIYETITNRSTVTEIHPQEEIEIPLSYNGSLGKPTVRIWCGLVIDSDMMPETYDGWTGSITSNVIEVDIIK
jgi:hypothetical protein